MPEWRAWNEQIARRGMLVRYDCRGAGLSDRDVIDYSLDAWLLDLEAIVDSLSLEQLVLFAPNSLAVPVAIAYAARWPQRVSHLFLWQAYAQTAHLAEQPGILAILDLVDKDWELFTEKLAHAVEGWSETETARRVAALYRENHTPQGLKAAFAAGMGIDVSALLPQVSSPTLVLHRRESSHDLSQSRKVASNIPHARLVVVEGSAGSWALQHPEAVLQAIDEFLGEGEKTALKLPSGTAIILFADIADSTALTERLGDGGIRAQARALDAALRTVIRDNAGTPIEGKLIGDGVLAVFASARQAIEAALTCARSGDEAGLPLHLGLHAGDVIREDGNVFGGAVNIAARISGLSAPGEVLVSQTVRDLARTSAGVRFEDRGERELKGVGEPVRVWRVAARDAAD
ncbi:MAG TPA: adenylate/guanylate cyclase domain-containing protein [Dehalococcoidia bacterium]|nr:adenylate/guanylate cyclase domain-containing protein [Dehalococcoidia bacterium]